jgi:hypothetical protein
MDEQSLKKSCQEEFLDELRKECSDPLHERLIRAYRSDDPVRSMESELSIILLEVLDREN